MNDDEYHTTHTCTHCMTDSMSQQEAVDQHEEMNNKSQRELDDSLFTLK